MTKEELLDEVYMTAYNFERIYGGCAQAVVGAFKKTIGYLSDSEYRAATGLAGGIGLSGNSCGAVTGSVMVIGHFIGRDYNNMDDVELVRKETYRLALDLIKKFESEYGESICINIQERVIGKAFNLNDENEYIEFELLGGHEEKCPSVCGNAARWTLEILLREGLIPNLFIS